MKNSKTKKNQTEKSIARREKINRRREKIIQQGEPEAFRLVNAKGRGKCVIVCDHASFRVPRSLGNLGLAAKHRKKHIAWDPGTADIGLYMCKALNATLVLAEYSRLVVDLNRGHTNKDCMRATSDGIAIPGNAKLSARQRKQRLAEFFWPYHDAVDRQIEKFLKKNIVPVLISVHSFTPVMDGFRRPWHMGVMWNKNPGIAKKLVRNLRKNNPKLVIGENEPYSLKEPGLGKDTIRRHAEKFRLPYIILEFRQDLVKTRKGALKFAKIFHQSVAPLLADPKTYRRQG